jgi:outer membrane protein TolC
VNRAKLIPKFYIEGSYGQSGEAYVSMPLSLTTVWSIAGRMSWTLWGNTMEVTQSNDHTIPHEIVDISSKVSGSVLDMKVGLFDDMNYFVDSKEGSVGYEQALAEYKDTRMKTLLDLQKAYNDYNSSLRSARTLKKEIVLRKRKLDLLRKRNELYEVPTVQVMEESWKYADAISAYGRAVTQNYASVSEMERLTMMPLR